MLLKEFNQIPICIYWEGFLKYVFREEFILSVTAIGIRHRLVLSRRISCYCFYRRRGLVINRLFSIFNSLYGFATRIISSR